MKVGIIGAGINGLYIANQLAQKGNEVTVFDKKNAIGDNVVCSGLFSDRLLNYFPDSAKLILNHINSVNVHFPKKTISVEFSRPFLVMEHAKLDKLVGDLALKNRVKITLNSPIKTVPEGFSRVIGCDGGFSATRRLLGLKNPKFRIGINGYVNLPDSSNFVDVWPINGGFIWKIPRGERTEYGIIGKPLTAITIFQKFLKDNKLYIPKIHSKIIPQGLVLPDSGNITLCGDAAGLTKPWSGGGVVWGFRAADMLVKTFPNFGQYSLRAKFFFGQKILLSKIAVWGVYFIGFNLPWLMPKKAKIESDYLF